MSIRRSPGACPSPSYLPALSCVLHPHAVLAVPAVPHHHPAVPAVPHHHPATSAVLCSKSSKDADAQVVRTCVLLDELIQQERPGEAGGPIIVAQARQTAVRFLFCRVWEGEAHLRWVTH